MIRRTFLRLLGLAPAIPLAAKLPALAAPVAPKHVPWSYLISDGYYICVSNPDGMHSWVWASNNSGAKYQVWPVGQQLPRTVRCVNAEFDDALAKIERANPGGLERAFKSAFRRP